jgi:hypothetical protein
MLETNREGPHERKGNRTLDVGVGSSPTNDSGSEKRQIDPINADLTFSLL